MSRVLLIKPRFFSLDFRAITHPLGLMYIGATLKQAGHEPRIHDCSLDYKDLHILKRTIAEFRPDFIGVSIIVTELKQTRKIMEIIRHIMPDVPVTFGGPWPSANPEESIKTFGADFVVTGEGEWVFPDLIHAINQGLSTDSIPGTASRVNGNIKVNPGQLLSENELDTLPFPAWDLLDKDLYAKNTSIASMGRRPYMTIVTSRGCPFKCAFCHQTMGKIFRKRSAQSVIAEMEILRFQHGLKEFEIVDDCFNLDRKRMIDILTGISGRIRDARLHFPNGLRADILEPADMSFFKKAGTVSVGFSIETSSARLQKMIHKNLIIDKAIRAIDAAVREGIFTTGYFMIGFPTETYEEAYETAELAARSSLHRAFFNNPTPYKGTELANMIDDNLTSRNNINPGDLNYFSGISIAAMTDSDLKKIFRYAYRRFYLNPKRIMGLIIHLPRILFMLPWYVFTLLIRILPIRHNSA